jgi:hypothetical protein
MVRRKRGRQESAAVHRGKETADAELKALLEHNCVNLLACLRVRALTRPCCCLFASRGFT